MSVIDYADITSPIAREAMRRQDAMRQRSQQRERHDRAALVDFLRGDDATAQRILDGIKVADVRLHEVPAPNRLVRELALEMTHRAIRHYQRRGRTPDVREIRWFDQHYEEPDRAGEMDLETGVMWLRDDLRGWDLLDVIVEEVAHSCGMLHGEDGAPSARDEQALARYIYCSPPIAALATR
jgi:hypothetical protein